MLEMFNKDGDYRLAYLQSFEFFLQAFTRGETKLTQQILEKSHNDNTITLNEKNSKYYYANKNYSILIEPIYEDDATLDTFTNGYIGFEDEDFTRLYSKQIEMRKDTNEKIKCLQKQIEN